MTSSTNHEDHCSRHGGIPQDLLSEDNRLHIELLVSAFGTGPWNIPANWHDLDLMSGKGTGFTMPARLATFDTDKLTRLVIGAHDMGVRVEIEPCNMQRLKIRMWTRKSREGRLWERHPTMEEAVRTFRRTKRSRMASLYARLTGSRS